MRSVYFWFDGCLNRKVVDRLAGWEWNKILSINTGLSETVKFWANSSTREGVAVNQITSTEINGPMAFVCFSFLLFYIFLATCAR